MSLDMEAPGQVCSASSIYPIKLHDLLTHDYSQLIHIAADMLEQAINAHAHHYGYTCDLKQSMIGFRVQRCSQDEQHASCQFMNVSHRLN